MISHRCLALVVFVCALGLGTLQLRAQTGTAAQSQSPDKPAAKPKVPKGCESGKMRCVSNNVRWEAAIQADDRRAADKKKHGGK